MEIDKLDLTSLKAERTRWIGLGGVELLVKLATPRELGEFQKRVRARGIFRATGADNWEIMDQERFRLEFARSFILDWRGHIEPPTPYSPELGAEMLGAIPGLGDVVWKEINDYAAFLANGSGAPT